MPLAVCGAVRLEPMSVASGPIHFPRLHACYLGQMFICLGCMSVARDWPRAQADALGACPNLFGSQCIRKPLSDLMSLTSVYELSEP